MHMPEIDNAHCGGDNLRDDPLENSAPVRALPGLAPSDKPKVARMTKAEERAILRQIMQ